MAAFLRRIHTRGQQTNACHLINYAASQQICPNNIIYKQITAFVPSISPSALEKQTNVNFPVAITRKLAQSAATCLHHASKQTHFSSLWGENFNECVHLSDKKEKSESTW